MDTYSFTVYRKTEHIYSDIVKDVKTIFDTSSYELDTLLPKVKAKKVIGLMKDKIGWKDNDEFAALRPKTYSYLTDENCENKKSKRHKKVRNKKT